MWSLLHCIFVNAAVHALNDPIVETNYGKIRGKWLLSQRNLSIASFIGIPYAESPVGDLRFKVIQSEFLNIIKKNVHANRFIQKNFETKYKND